MPTGNRPGSILNPQTDSSLRDIENVPLSEDVIAYFKREVLTHAYQSDKSD